MSAALDTTIAAHAGEQHVPVDLVPLHSENLGLLRRQFLQRDVWRNFGYFSPPTEFLLRMVWRQRQAGGVLFRRLDENELVGFALWFGETGPDASLEFAIALGNPGARGLHLGKRFGECAQDYVFGNRLCSTLWAWGYARNSAMLGLVRSCGWEVLGLEDGGRPIVDDGQVDTVEVQQTYERWAARRLSERGYVPDGFDPVFSTRT